MKIDELILFGQDDLLDESTIVLFRHYLEEALRGKHENVLKSLTWADN